MGPLPMCLVIFQFLFSDVGASINFPVGITLPGLGDKSSEYTAHYHADLDVASPRVFLDLWQVLLLFW